MIENPTNTILARRSPARTSPGIVPIRLTLALIAGIPLLLSFLVPIDRLALFECPFLTIFGLSGPFCGYTRSVWAISAGDWVYASVNCPLSWLLYAGLVMVFAWNAGIMLLGIKMKRPCILNLTRNQANRTAAVVIVLVLINWLYRLGLGLT